jgi:predicted nucleic acid-binding protein
MFKILIDTCVWLDLAKYHQRQAVLAVLEELARQKQVEIILPRIVMDEFPRNKARVAKESGRSLSGALQRAKEVVGTLGDIRKKRATLQQLSDVEFKIPNLGEAAIESIGRIEKLFRCGSIRESTDATKLRVVQCAIERRAPTSGHRRLLLKNHLPLLHQSR